MFVIRITRQRVYFFLPYHKSVFLVANLNSNTLHGTRKYLLVVRNNTKLNNVHITVVRVPTCPLYHRKNLTYSDLDRNMNNDEMYRFILFSYLSDENYTYKHK